MFGKNSGLGDYEQLQLQLQKSQAECVRLMEENSRLRAMLGLVPLGDELIQATDCFQSDQSSAIITISDSDNNDLHQNVSEQYQTARAEIITRKSSTESKIALFRNLFRGREDTYPVRWQSRDGKQGYNPACANEWKVGVCRKPKVKCDVCDFRKLLPVTDEVIYKHLDSIKAASYTVGVYPLLQDETCWFLAADFDKKTWQEDVGAFLKTCDEMGVFAVLERSRSGNGGHVWIFFDYPVAASLARKLGCAILTRTLNKRHQLGLDSYDRFFPNQDTMPKGRFGNLIALPLQALPRKNGNSLFLDRNFQPYPDQWSFLSTIKKMQPALVEAIVLEAAKSGTIIGVRQSLVNDESEEDPWTQSSSRKKAVNLISDSLPAEIRVVQSNLIYIAKDGLPSAMINCLMRIAAFQNPEFYKAQAMRFTTKKIPRIISCAEDFSRYVGLPRGCLEEVLELLKSHNTKVELADERFAGRPLDVTFQGELRILQKQAVEALLKHENEVLSATTAFGKTVVAAKLIAERKVNTLVLVHRRQLMDQWRQQLALFLGLSVKEIGQIGGGKDKPTGLIDVGILQSLNNKGEVKEIVADYGQVIVDECHHLAAVSFEQVLKKVKGRYVLGLTATPVRKDGQHPIILMQCGPIRFRVDAKKMALERPFDHVVIPRYTNFTMTIGNDNTGIQDIYAALVADKQRNDLIFDDLLKSLEAGRSPLLLTERTEHVNYFAERVKGFARNVVVLRGGMGKKQRAAVAEQLANISDEEERVLIATGRYIGEGFDDPRLDTLFLVMPVSWRGTLQQYAGRLHRLHDNKQVVQIYDYVDVEVPMLVRMYQKRLKGYGGIGYKVQREGEDKDILRNSGRNHAKE